MSNEKKLTINENGSVFPIGLNGNKEFSVRPWRMKEEKEIGDLRDKNSKINFASFTGIVLSHMCNSWAGNDFSQMKLEEKRIIVGQTPAQDVLYAWMFLRVNSLGKECNMKLTCPKCDEVFDFVADLGSAEVRTAEKEEECFFTYKLRDPFEIRSKLVEEIVFGPSTWSTFENLNIGANMINTGSAKSDIIRGSIKEIPGVEACRILGPNELDNMSKYDLERISLKLDEEAPGVNFAIEALCTKCGKEFVDSLNWRYDDFFGTSSR